ncbi:M48 family peptidase [Bacteroidetes/Chlorobi group bacterium ChocPot_Mid]|jgi:predicted metal-dependent hydrolase|nr:MAG: M48 family peptidase [Bacteroidetes/Chlorobi group bacterium ChocPot_Mid]
MDDIKIDRIIRSKRRTFSIEINPKGLLTIRAPLRASNGEIKNIIKDKYDWIKKKKKEISKKMAQKKKRHYVNGEKFECLGKEYTLILKDNHKFAFSTSQDKLILNSNYQKVARNLLIYWYKNQALKYITRRASHFAEIMNTNFNRINITGANTRWGSCSNNKNLNFSWKLILAPKQIVDYVIVHELSHLFEMSHSKKFWNRVAQVLPNYMIYETWLKENGHLLDL